MDSLDDTEWDVIISGTGIKQSLLALSLSRSGRRILHIDSNAYYGSHEAALSLAEAEAWAEQYAGTSGVFTNAVINKSKDRGPSRAYSLALAPQLIFAKSNLLSALVSSHVHSQLEFQAVGSWFVKQDGLVKVPGGREDIFQDTSLDLRTKRALMKFIRSINVDELELDDSTVPTYLEKFGIPASAHAPIMALTLSPAASVETPASTAIPNVVRHLQSIGHFGPGFGSLTPKYGGLAELAQVACRACAVGGGVYVLGRGFELVDQAEVAVDLGADSVEIQGRGDELIPGAKLTLKLGEDTVKTQWLVSESHTTSTTIWSRGIYIVDSSLKELFPPTSEGGVIPAGAVIMVPSDPPIYILAHSSDTGECPSSQCVLYASIQLPMAHERLRDALQVLSYPVIWSMHFQQAATMVEHTTGKVRTVATELGLAVEDSMLEDVQQIWHDITGDPVEQFLKFEARTAGDDDDDDDDD